MSSELSQSGCGSQWERTVLGQLLSMANGKSSPVRIEGASYPVYGSNGVIGHCNDLNAHKGTIVIGRVGSYCGSLQFSDEDCWVTDNAIRANVVADHDAKFLYYLMQTLNLNSWRSGSGQPLLNQTTLSSIPVSVPSPLEQRRIAHVLGTLDDKIELNRRINTTLEGMAQALFKSWFMDFEPVRAKMDGRWRRGESLPGMPTELYDLFPDRLVPSKLGEMPEGWEVKTLDQLVDLNPREPLKRGTRALYLNMAALPTEGCNPDDAILREYTSGTRFRNEDTLLARITPCLENGKTAYIQSLPSNAVGWGSTEFIAMRAIPPVPSEYTYLLARDESFRAHAIQNMTGTSGRQRVQAQVLSNYPLPSPQEEIWPAFSILTKPLFAKIKLLSEDSRALAGLRDAMLPRLVSGEAVV